MWLKAQPLPVMVFQILSQRWRMYCLKPMSERHLYSLMLEHHIFRLMLECEIYRLGQKSFLGIFDDLTGGTCEQDGEPT